MRTYDTFNPTIPDPEENPEEPREESPVVDNLPPATVVDDRTVRRPVQKPRPKVRKEKPAPRPKPEKVKKEKTPSVPISDIVKEWLGGQTVRWIIGLFCGFFAVYLGVSFLSYMTSCISDQSQINHSPIGTACAINNAGGEGGARISEFLINECFGLGSIVIVVWFAAMALKQLVGQPRFKSVDFTIKCFVALITVSLIIGLMTIGLKSPVNWGGFHGRYVNEFIIHFFGVTGAIILCLFFIALFVIICMRDLINWIIRLKRKRDERKRIEAERRAEKERKEAELEAMRQREAAEAAKAGEATQEPEPEPEETGPVTFGNMETGLYTSLPDFEDVEYVRPEEGGGEASETYTMGATQEVNTNMAGVATTSPENPDIVAGSEEMAAPSAQSPAAVPVEYPTETAGDEAKEEQEEEEEPDMVVNVNTIAQTTSTHLPDNAGLPGAHPYKFPPYEILRAGEERISVDTEEQLENKDKIKKTLLDFGIPIISIEATVGPTVTLYEIVPDKGVRIAKIRTLVDDIALSLAAEGVRIIAPIPGKGTVGIEVANKDPQTVSMRTIIKSRAYQESKYKLPIALGSTISNEVYIADLAKMPHLLVAGATGQGKSVGLNAIIASLLYRKTPDELKFVMIDPKMVEFSLYAKIESHYLAKIPGAEDAIITDMDKVVATLSSLCVEMDNRYQLLKDAHTRNIIEYNDKIKARVLNPADGHRFMPYIVVVVDEFSDLIMTAGKEVEVPIARLAQKARAVGMHVIIATQRPSTNVITGIIKANFPARIAFKVSSGVDSKTILDTTGAQQLIGRGDMLISNSSPMVRVQCAFIDTPEVEEICDYIEKQPWGQGAYELPDPVVTGADGGESEVSNTFGDRDPLFDEVARLVVTSNTASTSSLQRRYSIGYNRAGKIMDQLEAAGVVGPAQGGKPRAVLVDPMTLESILNQRMG